MALTFGKVNLATRDHVYGNRREIVTDVTLDNSYPTGGYVLAAKDVGMDIALDSIRVDATTTGHTFVYNYATGKLMLFSGGTQVADTTDVHTVVGRLTARGKGTLHPFS